MPKLIPAGHGVSIERPIKLNPLLYKAKSLIHIILPTPTTCPTPRLRSYLIDTNFKSHARLCSTNGYWPTQRVTIITALDARLKFLDIAISKCRRFQCPARIEGTKMHSIA